MKTKSDLLKLFPLLINQLKENDHEIPMSFILNSDGSGDPEENYFSYEEDGWQIEVVYDCWGEWEVDEGDYWTPSNRRLVKAWGEVTNLSVTHYDEETDEETEFSQKDLTELYNSLNEALLTIS